MREFGSSRRALVSFATIATVASLALSGCSLDGGGSGEIPKSEGDQLMAALNQVEQATDEGDCEQAQTAATQFANDTASADLADDLKEPLTQGAERVQDLLAQQCAETGTTDVTETPSTDQSQDTTTSTTSTTRTTPKPETEPPADEETQAPPEEESEAPEEPSDEGGEEPQAPPDTGDDGSGAPDGGVGAPTGGTGAGQGGN